MLMPCQTAFPARATQRAAAALAMMLLGWLGAAPGIAFAQADVEQRATEDAATQYVANVRRLMERQVLPALRVGIVKIAIVRPPLLTIEVTEDPSPYRIGARINPDGSLTVRLSIGYLTLHDAALDAVAMSALLQRPQELRRYLTYQLRLARLNHLRRAQAERPERAMTFADFIGLDEREARAIFARPQWRALRESIEADSLGWTVAHLLVRADPRLAGNSSAAAARSGAGAADLAAASGWFPVPPFATALGVAAIERPVSAPFDEQALLCRAARLMETGLLSVHGSEHEADWQKRGDEVRSQIARMRRDGRCSVGATVADAAHGLCKFNRCVTTGDSS